MEFGPRSKNSSRSKPYAEPLVISSTNHVAWFSRDLNAQGVLELWNSETDMKRRFSLQTGPTRICFVPDGSRAMLGCKDGDLQILNLPSSTTNSGV